MSYWGLPTPLEYETCSPCRSVSEEEINASQTPLKQKRLEMVLESFLFCNYHSTFHTALRAAHYSRTYGGDGLLQFPPHSLHVQGASIPLQSLAMDAALTFVD